MKIKFVALLGLYASLAISPSIASDKYYLVEWGLDSNLMRVAYPQLASTHGFKIEGIEQENWYISPHELSKDECAIRVDKIINSYKKTYNRVMQQKDSFYNSAKRSIARQSYIVDELSDEYNSYYCIPVDIWSNIKSGVNKTEEDYIKGDEQRYKDIESFIEILKPCGISKLTVNNVLIPETPFICEKYNVDQLIPHKTYNELVGYQKFTSSKK